MDSEVFPVRRTRLLLPALLLSVAALGTACGGSGGGSRSLPTVTGAYGDQPTITFHGKAPTTLEKKVLKEGTGPAVAKGDLMVVDSLAQIYDGKVFDNSYERHQPFGTPVGTGQVLPGWDEAMLGVKAGSRILLLLPPDKAYGAQGNAQAGIKGTDTLVFVIDVINVYGAKATGDPNATKVAATTGGVTVGGTLGARPTVAVKKGTAVPKKPTTILLAKGSGPAVKTGFIVLQYEAVNWASASIASTWKTGSPTGVGVGGAATPNPFDGLVGLPIGSRVLVEIPPQAGAKPTDSAAVVVDIVAEPGTAKQTAAG